MKSIIKNMRNFIICVVLLFMGTLLRAQSTMEWRLNKWEQKVGFYFLPNSLFDYNPYEGCRWGLGFSMIAPLANGQDTLSPSIRLAAKAGYGVVDHQFKYSGSAWVYSPKTYVTDFCISYGRDILPVGDRNYAPYSIVDIPNNIHYLSRHNYLYDGINIGVGKRDIGPISAMAALTYLKTCYLFDLNFVPGATPNPNYCANIANASLQITWKGLHVDLEGGQVLASSSCGESRRYNRILLQWDHTRVRNSSKGNKLNTFVQVGLNGSANTPLSRMFNLGGSAGSYYNFRHGFNTLQSDMFMANNFVQLCLNYTLGHPLWDTRFSKPKPFGQVNALWGNLHGEKIATPEGDYVYVHDLQQDRLLKADEVSSILFQDPIGCSGVIEYQTPDRGLIEPTIGLKSIVHIGWLDMGVAASYLLAPKKADYHRPNASDNLFFSCVATLVFDR